MTDAAHDPADKSTDAVDPRLRARPWHPDERAAFDSMVTSLVETRKMIAAMQAFEASVLAAAAELATARVTSATVSELSIREVSAEIGAALHLNDRTVQNLLGSASVLTQWFPATHRALQEGRIGAAHVRVIVDAGGVIPDADARAAYETAVLEVAQSETAGRLRPMAKVLADRAHPLPIAERHLRARVARRVTVDDLDDGMALLQAPLPAVLAHGIVDRLTGMARAVVDARRVSSASVGSDEVVAPDERTMDQLRADLLSDLLLTGTPTAHGDGLDAIRGTVQVTVPVLTLAGESQAPALLAGYGPIDAATARRLAAGAAGWERVMTHPVSGQVIAVDRYRPGKKLQRWLRVRDEHCRFPGCRMPTWRCDLDHNHDHALGGPTDRNNLAAECKRHHVLKTNTVWTCRQGAGGVLEWMSPTGRVYIDHPRPLVSFVAAYDPTYGGDPPPW